MKSHNNQFGLTGQSDLDYDFFIGRGKKRKGRLKKILRKLVKPSPILSAVTKKILRPASSPAPAAPSSVSTSPLPEQQATAESSTDTSMASTATPQPSEPEIQEAEGLSETGAEIGSEDSFLGFGKKAKARRELKRAEKAAGVERTKAETATIQSMNASTAPTSGSTSTGTAANAPVTEEQSTQGENKSKSGNTMLIVAIVGGVIVVGIGLMIMLKKPDPGQMAAQ